MKTLGPEEFEEFFVALHGHVPFPWQTMLLERVADEGWPDLIDLPTASGKTACIDVAVFALALQADQSPDQRTAARRIWFVVNRRIVVDEAFYRAARIAERLRTADAGILKRVADCLRRLSGGGLPLAVARLRGGVPKQVAWSLHPAQPAIITSTVDQVGSRLLFRGYGVSPSSWPIHAALVGNDSLIVVDEAHTATAFCQTIQRIRQLRKSGVYGSFDLPFGVVQMSATLPQTEAAVFPSSGLRDKALNHSELRRRYAASKPAELVISKGDRHALVAEAADWAQKLANGHTRVAVMVNRVATAQDLAAELKKESNGGKQGEPRFYVVLLTGRMRPVDRDELVSKWTPYLRAGRPELPDRPIILVTTQCLEVGADFSFDALVTECASLDALRQRFGRLNRMGDTEKDPAPAVILIQESQIKPKHEDPVYGPALAETWAWLQMIANDAPVEADSAPSKGKRKKVDVRKVVDFGIEAMKPHTRSIDPKLLAPAPDAPILLPAYIDLWAQTGPTPSIEPEPALFLHGPERGLPEASIVFRADLNGMEQRFWPDTVALLPPMPGEKLAVPLWRLRKWLVDSATLPPDETSDVEEERPSDNKAEPTRSSSQQFVIYRGRSEVIFSGDPAEIRPGDTIVVAAPPEFPTALGTSLNTPRIDVCEQAWSAARAENLIRVRRKMEAEQPMPPEVIELASPGDADFDREALIEALGELVQSPRVMLYPDRLGCIVFSTATDRRIAEELDPFDFDDLKLIESSGSEGLELASHTDGAADLARKFAEKCVRKDLADAVRQAVVCHDWGKADPRFQFCLQGGRRPAGGLLAKSRVPISPLMWRRLRTAIALPDGFRHEMLSMQLADRATASDAEHRDLILHLIAAHHGHARPFAPVSVDDTPPDVELNGVRISGDERNNPPPHRLDSGVADRFWRLTRQYGWWGLAYLEALVRLADRQVSREQEARQ